VPTLPGTENPIDDPRRGLKVAKEIGFPLIIKAAFAAADADARGEEGGRSADCWTRRATKRAGRSNPRCFWKNIFRARNTSRCRSSATPRQRAASCMSAIAPSSGGIKRWWRDRPSSAWTEGARGIMRRRAGDHARIRYDNADVEFFWTWTRTNVLHRDEPRIQWSNRDGSHHEHRPGALADSRGASHALHGSELDLPPQPKCRATAWPCNAASPRKTRKINSRRITAHSHVSFGGRFRAAARWRMARGSVITPFYDSLLVKVTGSGPDVRDGVATAWTARCASSASAA